MKSRKKSRNSHCKEIAWNLQNLNCGLYDTWMNGMNCKAVRNHHCHPTGHAVEFNNSAAINDDDVDSDLDGGDSYGDASDSQNQLVNVLQRRSSIFPCMYNFSIKMYNFSIKCTILSI